MEMLNNIGLKSLLKGLPKLIPHYDDSTSFGLYDDYQPGDIVYWRGNNPAICIIAHRKNDFVGGTYFGSRYYVSSQYNDLSYLDLRYASDFEIDLILRTDDVVCPLVHPTRIYETDNAWRWFDSLGEPSKKDEKSFKKLIVSMCTILLLCLIGFMFYLKNG